MFGLVRVLLVCDDERLCDGLVESLRTCGFDVDAIDEREEGLRRALSGRYAVAVVALVQALTDGLEAVRRIRVESAIPVLAIIPGEDGVDCIIALEMGADDCLPRLCSPREVAARLRALLRRTTIHRWDAAQAATSGDTIIVVGDLQIDPASRTVECAGQHIGLTTTEFDLLAALARSAGRALTREELSAGVFGREGSPADRSIDVHISRLRRKLDRASTEAARRIKTLRGTGYICTLAR